MRSASRWRTPAVLKAGPRQALAQACEVERLRCASSPCSAWSERTWGSIGTSAGGGGQHAGLYLRRYCHGHRLSFGSALAGRPRPGLHERQPVVNTAVFGPRLHRQRTGAALRQLSHKAASTSMRWRASGTATTNAAPDPDRRPGAAHRDGLTGANQFLGQAEGGYKSASMRRSMPASRPSGACRPASRKTRSSESGAQSLNLTVAQQTTNSLRTTFGADLAPSIGLGAERKLALAVRLGWTHEFADIARPSPPPSGARRVLLHRVRRHSAARWRRHRLAASTAIAASTQLYLRYDGEIGTGTDNHALTAGLRMSW